MACSIVPFDAPPGKVLLKDPVNLRRDARVYDTNLHGLLGTRGLEMGAFWRRFDKHERDPELRPSERGTHV